MSKTGKDSLLGNKIAAGLLTAGLIFWGANRIASIVVPDEALKTSAIKLAGLQSAAAPAVMVAGLEAIAPLIATADVAKGMAFVQEQCSSCHTVTKGGAAGVGPNLYGVVGGPMFASAGFTYSDAVKAKAKGDWNYDNLNAWLSAPQSFAPGTEMSYPGIHNTEMRADVVAYLRTLSATPLALPPATAGKGASVAPKAVATAAPAAPGIDALFATADIAKGGAFVAQECSGCHTLGKGEAAGMGPNLYGIVGAKAFSQAGFSYSGAVAAKAGAIWTPETLSAWLLAPQSFAPGTAMFFPGIKNDQMRANVIAYLNKNSDHPVKLPGA